MTISDVRERCKGFIRRIPRDVACIAVILLASSFSFGLGLLAGMDARGTGSITVEAVPDILPPMGGDASTQTGQVVASKLGSRYYFPRCSGAGRISDENKVRFSSAAAAEQAGYTLAANCK